MMGMTLAEAAAVLNLPAPPRDAGWRGVSIDTRTLAPGNLFVALPGSQRDGHDFIPAAAKAGAAAGLAERTVATDLPVLEVPSARRALGELARSWRQRFESPVAGVTGSNGKTTVKLMLAAILAEAGPVLATEGNLNNELGVPLTLARLSAEHRHAVIEMGANHAGEIRYLTGLAGPDVAIITNCGPAHLEGFGSLEGVARAKGEILEGLGEQGTAVLNADDRFLAYWQAQAPGPVLRFGTSETADVRVAAFDAGGVRLETPAGPLVIGLALPGRHNALNAAAATAAALALGIDSAAIRRGLEGMRGERRRLEVRQGDGNLTIIDDSYNANPASLAAALDYLAAQSGHRWLVLGDMGELGTDGETLHREAGTMACRRGVERLFAIGDLAGHAADAFGDKGHVCADHQAALKALREELTAAEGPVYVLVKGSRAAALERVADALSEGGSA